ncbi:IS5 family transposase [Rhabdochlamydiaceae symbiont of Dictyostelium giganteum]|uniref:IS5 family transposase n=1 Tax=Rhabdochlamydiaceae symbiont of Dictyostelium giganteum TaxID=3342349 RepID=UPI003850F2A8
MRLQRNWPKYNRSLVNRGRVSFWFDFNTLRQFEVQRQKKNGRPFIYPDFLIVAMITLRFYFHLSLRATEGFFQEILELQGIDMQSPSYTQLCRRMKNLPLPKNLVNRKEITDIVLDSTGLKVYGKGEWCASKYGGRSKWNKLHIAMDLESGKIILAEVGNEYEADTTHFEKALKKANSNKGRVLMDGIADNENCYALAKKYNKELLTPPRKGAIIRDEPVYEKRNEAVHIIKGLGGDLEARSLWGKMTGYN